MLGCPGGVFELIVQPCLASQGQAGLSREALRCSLLCLLLLLGAPIFPTTLEAENGNQLDQARLGRAHPS